MKPSLARRSEFIPWDEPAGQRAASLVENRCQDVRVELNHDHECTKRLINLARTTNLFVFAWKSSKHQAFYCVKDHRDADNPIVQAQAKALAVSCEQCSNMLENLLFGPCFVRLWG